MPTSFTTPLKFFSLYIYLTLEPDLNIYFDYCSISSRNHDNEEKAEADIKWNELNNGVGGYRNE